LAGTHSVEGRSSVRQEATLIGPVERQIAAEIQDVARAAEDAGFEAAFCAEVNNDAIASAELMGLATSRLKVGMWVAHIYLHLPYLCAKAAALAADATGGRFILGLGVSHQPVNRALGIDMPNPSTALRSYATEVDAVEEGLAVAISTADLAAAISHELQSILAGIAETVRMAGLRFDQIDKVFTTGGSTAIPMMKTWIEASFPHAETVEGDRFGSVGKGLRWTRNDGSRESPGRRSGSGI
jgi:alkanesulfonate monooxygenase SsuD/methylene tetrahydromethanopterin reductase-like flavin-dependent oxidoreductase (luciferase family)